MRGRIQAKYKTFGALEAFTLMFVEWDQCEPKEHEYALDHSFRLMISGARMAVSYSENEKLTAFSNMRNCDILFDNESSIKDYPFKILTLFSIFITNHTSYLCGNCLLQMPPLPSDLS